MTKKPAIHKIVHCGNKDCNRYLCTIDVQELPPGLPKDQTIVEVKELYCSRCKGKTTVAIIEEPK